MVHDMGAPLQLLVTANETGDLTSISTAVDHLLQLRRHASQHTALTHLQISALLSARTTPERHATSHAPRDSDEVALARGRARLRTIRAHDAEQPEPADLAHALVGLVAENVGVLARLVAAVSQARRIVYGGSTLREPSVLQPILVDCAPGSEVIFLEQGEYAGALGALELLAR